MEEDKANPISLPPNPLPSWLEDQQLSDWEEYSDPELYSFGKVEGYEEPSDWEECIGQEFSKGNDNRPSVQSSWEDDSDNELAQDNWEHVSIQSVVVKPLPREEDDWDELSDVELSEEGDREQRQAHFAEDGLPVPVPREAWVEGQAFEPCPQVPLYALPPHLQAQAPRGHWAFPAFEQQVSQARTDNLLPALHSSPSRSAPQLRAKAPHKKHPSRFRWALWVLCSLFCSPCVMPLPEDED